MADNAFDFVVSDRDGKDFPLAQFRGRVMLIVNTAPKSALTQQLEGLEKLWEEFRDRGLVVLGFPCDQFANQEPDAEVEMGDFCSSNYNVSFPILGKVDVNGDNASPLFTWLKERGSGVISNRIKWNFTKFLVSADGTKVERYAPMTRPDELRGDVMSALYEIVAAEQQAEQDASDADAVTDGGASDASGDADVETTVTGSGAASQAPVWTPVTNATQTPNAEPAAQAAATDATSTAAATDTTDNSAAHDTEGQSKLAAFVAKRTQGKSTNPIEQN